MKTILIIMFITQGYGADDARQIEFPDQAACDHALETMVRTGDVTRGYHRSTQVIAFCAPEGSQPTGGLMEKLRESRR